MARYVLLPLANSASRLGIGLLLLSVVLQVGCKRSAAVTDSERANNAAPRRDGSEEFAFTGLDGEQVHFADGKPVALPADFPADVTVYPEAIVTMTATGKKEMRVTLNTADSVEKVAAFYEKKLKEDGWKPDNAIKQPQYLEATKKGRSLSVDIKTQAGKTTVCLTIAKEKAASTTPQE
jgi:hypothetical protein